MQNKWIPEKKQINRIHDVILPILSSGPTFPLFP